MNALMYALTASTPTFDATVFQGIDFSPLATVASTVATAVIPIVVIVMAYKAGIGLIKSIGGKAR